MYAIKHIFALRKGLIQIKMFDLNLQLEGYVGIGKNVLEINFR